MLLSVIEMRLSIRHLIFMVLLVDGQAEPCTKYGCPGRPHYEPFVPAPPGHTPRCAKPGQTFCETLDHYPQQLIKFLVDKCSFDFSTVLRDESQEDFNTYRQEVHQLYPQPLPFLPATYGYEPERPSPVYGPAINDTRQHGYKYVAALQTQSTPLDRYQPQSHHINRPFHPQNSHSSAGPWSNRYARSSKAPPRTVNENPLLSYASSRAERAKRQSALDAVALCPTRPQYITPKAALNNQGNWMYVVNVQDRNEKYTQVVRSETCSTDTCNGLCSLPTGYSSRCQQQYVQKRLVALEGSGNRLYTDVFWFPHGCSCQVSLNY